MSFNLPFKVECEPSRLSQRAPTMKNLIQGLIALSSPQRGSLVQGKLGRNLGMDDDTWTIRSSKAHTRPTCPNETHSPQGGLHHHATRGGGTRIVQFLNSSANPSRWKRWRSQRICHTRAPHVVRGYCKDPTAKFGMGILHRRSAGGFLYVVTFIDRCRDLQPIFWCCASMNCQNLMRRRG